MTDITPVRLMGSWVGKRDGLLLHSKLTTDWPSLQRWTSQPWQRLDFHNNSKRRLTTTKQELHGADVMQLFRFQINEINDHGYHENEYG